MQWLDSLRARVKDQKPILQADLLKLMEIADTAEELAKAMFPVKGLVKTSKQYMDGVAAAANKLRVILEIDNNGKGSNQQG